MAQGGPKRVSWNCPDITKSEIESIMMGQTGFPLSNPRALHIFRAYIDFLDSQSSGAYKQERMSLKYITCYEISQKLLDLKPNERMGYKRNEELFAKSEEPWKGKLKKNIKGDPKKLEQLLHIFMQELKQSFEGNDDYKSFKKELSEKLQKKKHK